MGVYYNEIEPFAAAWLRELIKAGVIADGIVDERSIEDIQPNELAGFTQCHFFAGIGVWSYSLRQAGWPDDRPVWTGSCPCQPFSTAGKGAGFADKRHLWPAWQWLIEKCRPSVVFGEQVAAKAVEPWIDLVQADVEALGYAFGCVPFPSAGVGAPHIRDRAYWLATTLGAPEKPCDLCGFPYEHSRGRDCPNCEGHWLGAVADPAVERLNRRRASEASDAGVAARKQFERLCNAGAEPVAVNGFWRSADWIACSDGSWRPVEPGTSPLAHGAPARMGRLRGYGNTINAKAAEEFIRAAAL